MKYHVLTFIPCRSPRGENHEFVKSGIGVSAKSLTSPRGLHSSVRLCRTGEFYIQALPLSSSLDGDLFSSSLFLSAWVGLSTSDLNSSRDE